MIFQYANNCANIFDSVPYSEGFSLSAMSPRFLAVANSSPSRGFLFGVGSTIVSFVVLGNYGLGVQLAGGADFVASYAASGDVYSLILDVVRTMPGSNVILVLILLCMVAFYATSFDSIAYTAACYSYKRLGENEKPHWLVSLLWCILLIVLPVALVFSESSMANIQSISIISAFPIGIIMIVMIWSFIKDAKKYLEEKKKEKE